MRNHILVTLVTGIALSLLSSCGSVITGASPVINQNTNEFGVTISIAEDYSPQEVNLVLPVRVNVDGAPLEIATLYLYGKDTSRNEAIVQVIMNWDNYERYHKNIANLRVTNQLPNGMGHLSRLRVSGKSFIVEPYLWAVGIYTDVARSGLAFPGSQTVEVQHTESANGIFYTPVVESDGSLPDKLYFGAVARLDVFKKNPAYEMQFAIPFEIKANNAAGVSTTYAVAGLIGAGDQAAGEYPGLFIFTEINALRSLSAEAATSVSDVDISDEENDHVILPRRSRTTRDEVIDNVEVFYEKMKAFSL